MPQRMVDAVLSWHTNPYSCGVAKFNQLLARKLGVPCDLLNYGFVKYQHPLVSVKTGELGPNWANYLPRGVPFDLLLHDRPPLSVAYADRVFFADELGCPSTVEGDSTRGTLDILAFGMNHKLTADKFQQLKTFLDSTHEHYTVSLSTGVHEGSPWDTAFAESVDGMRELFGDHLRVLGFLTDDGLARMFTHVNAVALFFEPAVRANNTTLWAALEAGVPVITNLDACSPKELQHNVSVFNLSELTEWPDAARLREVRWGGREASQVYSWDRLVKVLQG